MRTAAMACPRSCWQYRKARSPYFQASRQWIDVSAIRNDPSSSANGEAPNAPLEVGP